jgi:hypothetical protein
MMTGVFHEAGLQHRFYVVAGALAATHRRRLSTTEGQRHGIG